jgi:hypothetical protein
LIVERPGVESTQQALNICEFRTGLRPILMDETMALTVMARDNPSKDGLPNALRPAMAENGMIINGWKPSVVGRSARLRTNAGR